MRVKEEQRKKRKKLEREEKLKRNVNIWINEIIPDWEKKFRRRSYLFCRFRTHKTRTLLWSGIPPKLRGDIWLLSIGNDLNITRSF